MKQFLLIALIILPSTIFANSAATSHSPKVLLGWSFFNFVILFGLAGYKLKGTFTNMFNKKREEIKAIYTQAMEKQKNAQLERDNLQMEIANLSNFEDKVMKETIGNTLKFKEHYKKEIDEKIVRVQHESEQKIETTKKNGSEDVKKELLESVIVDVKEMLAADASLKKKVSEKILSNIG